MPQEEERTKGALNSKGTWIERLGGEVGGKGRPMNAAACRNGYKGQGGAMETLTQGSYGGGDQCWEVTIPCPVHLSSL